MNKPEPLKGKLREGICPNTFNFYDVRSAVEWAKECIFNHNWEPEKITKSDVIKILDEAFPDVKNQTERDK